jgi:ribosome-binding protein aMBF1 (putative translation factor)
MGAELAMITGARKLLGWRSSRLAQRAKVHSAIVRRAESVDGQPPITGLS